MPVEERTPPSGSQVSTIGTGEIGNRSAQDRSFDGIIDEYQIFNSVLSASQVKLLYNQGKAAVWGAASTTASGVSDWSSERGFCPPGDNTANCAPIAYWPIDENTGSTTTYDISGNGQDMDMTSGMNENDWVSGVYGSALEFDGVDDYLDNNDTTYWDFGTSTAFTVEAWFKMDSTDSTDRKIVQADRATGKANFEIYYEGDRNVLQANIGVSGAWCTMEGTIDVEDGLWHHVAAVYNRNASCTTSDILIYLDGIQESTTVLASSGNSNQDIDNDGLWIGGPTSFLGPIDDVRIYNYARTPAQIAWDYNQGAPVGWWKMDENQGTANINDSMGNIDPLTVVGSPTWSSGVRNTSLYFDGSDDFIDETGSAPYDPALIITGDLTLAFWTKAPAFQDLDNILSHRCNTAGSACNNNYILRIDTASGNDIEYEHHYGSEVDETYTFDTNLSVDTWYHITVVRDVTANTVKMYINGKKTGATFNYTNDPTDGSNGQLRLGNSSASGSSWYNGYLDDLRIYRYALSQQQIRGIISEGALRFGPDEGSP
jgi:hypothetical protein